MRFRSKELEQFAASVMHRAGMPEGDAALVASNVIRADLRGVSSHGLTRFKTYVARVEQGLVDPTAELKILSDAPSMLVIDGQNASGVVTAAKVMRLCMDRAKETGCCFASVRGGNHFGIAEFYSEQAAAEDMIGIAMANGPAAIAPIGGKKAVFGTNPLSVSIPSAAYGRINLDMATSIVAQGKVKLASKEGREIPPTWGLDAEGRPTTDPKAVKFMNPFGGPKGFGICMIIEILCSALSGAGTGLTMGSLYDFSGKKQNSGFFLGAMDVSRLMDPELFKANVDAIADSVKNAPKADGVDEIFLPGEIERKKAEKAESEGIRISAQTFAELRELSEKYGVALPEDLETA